MNSESPEFLQRIEPELVAGLAFYELSGLSQHQVLTRDVVVDLRTSGNAMIAKIFAEIPVDPRVTRTDHVIPTDGGDVAVRVFRPVDAAADEPLPGLIWLHGGGTMFATMVVDGPLAERFAVEARCAVICVEYRLAPEHPYPAAVDDCYAALRWTSEQAETLGVDPARIAVGGESAGGLLAAATVLAARDRQGPAIAFQLLAYPMIDDASASASMLEFDAISSWSREHNQWAWRHYLGDNPAAASDPLAVPARATSLAGLPPTLVQASELDSLRDEGVEYALRLLRDGVSTELHVYPSAYHAWDASAPQASASLRAVDERIDALRRVLHPEVQPG